MRPDVKLGVVISLAVVLVAGGYYLYRDSQGEPIPMSAGPPHASEKARTSSRVREDHENVAKAKKRFPVKGARRRSNPGAAASESPVAREADARHPSNGKKPPATRTVQDKEATGRAATTKVPSKMRPGGAARIASRVGPRSSGNAATAEAKPRKTNSAPFRRRTNRPTAGADVVPEVVKDSTRVASTQQPARSSPPRTTRSRPKKSTSVDSSTRKNDAAVAVDKHRVQAGDSFASIAVMYYGHEKYTRILARENPQIEDPRRLRVGQIISIPVLPEGGEPAVGTVGPLPAKASATEGRNARTYRVKPGDSFYAIARRELGDASRWEELFALNKHLVGGDPRKLQVGQVIRFPNG